eukprot:scaffold34218_cov59-Phaeocystis_antarctica.AAC.3
MCTTLSASATSSFGPVIAVPSLDPALLVAAEHPVYHSINARVPSVPHRRVPLRARGSWNGEVGTSRARSGSCWLERSARGCSELDSLLG